MNICLPTFRVSENIEHSLLVGFSVISHWGYQTFLVVVNAALLPCIDHKSDYYLSFIWGLPYNIDFITLYKTLICNIVFKLCFVYDILMLISLLF